MCSDKATGERHFADPFCSHSLAQEYEVLNLWSVVALSISCIAARDNLVDSSKRNGSHDFLHSGASAVAVNRV